MDAALDLLPEPASLSATVLIIDDEALIRWALRETLLAEGHRVLEAGTAAEALRHAATADIAVAIVDMRLPDMDGMTLLERLRALQPRMVPIILSALDPVEEEEPQRQALHVFRYVRKPFDPDELVELVSLAESSGAA